MSLTRGGNAIYECLFSVPQGQLEMSCTSQRSNEEMLKTLLMELADIPHKPQPSISKCGLSYRTTEQRMSGKVFCLTFYKLTFWGSCLRFIMDLTYVDAILTVKVLYQH